MVRVCLQNKSLLLCFMSTIHRIEIHFQALIIETVSAGNKDNLFVRDS